MSLSATFPKPAASRLSQQLWPLAGLSVGLVVVAVAGTLFDTRILDEAGVWIKPLKFALSFTVYFATLALVVDRFSAEAKQSAVLRVTIIAVAVSAIGELAYLYYMAGQADRSHFNTSSPTAILLYQIMGVGALTLMAGVGVIGVLAWRDKAAPFGPGLRAGIGAGFLMSVVLTIVTAGALGANGGHFVGVPVAGAATIPLLGWSGSVGDLRPAHFLALHAMQALPLAGLAIDRARVSPRTLGIVAVVYTAVTLAVFAQALNGLPLVRL